MKTEQTLKSKNDLCGFMVSEGNRIEIRKTFSFIFLTYTHEIKLSVVHLNGLCRRFWLDNN